VSTTSDPRSATIVAVLSAAFALPGLIALAAAAPLAALSREEIFHAQASGRLVLLNLGLFAGAIGVFTVPVAWLLTATMRHDRRVMRLLWILAVLALLGEAACVELVVSGRGGDFPLFS
jgi:hypothetical protein